MEGGQSSLLWDKRPHGRGTALSLTTSINWQTREWDHLEAFCPASVPAESGPSTSTDETNRRTTETTHRTGRNKKSLCQALNFGVVCYVSWDNWQRPTSFLLGIAKLFSKAITNLHSHTMVYIVHNYMLTESTKAYIKGAFLVVYIRHYFFKKYLG